MKTINTTQQVDKKKQSSIGFKVALNILDHWGCSNEQMMAIVQLGRASFFKYKKSPDTVNLNSDQLDRVSYVLNIHSALRLIFSNPENVYGFVNKKNNNPYFNGKTPLELMSTGKFGILHDVYRNIDTMRGGQW